MSFEFHRSDINYHDHSKVEAANWDVDVPYETVHGPKITYLKIHRGLRFIFYWPSGAWCHLDVRRKTRPV